MDSKQTSLSKQLALVLTGTERNDRRGELRRDESSAKENKT